MKKTTLAFLSIAILTTFSGCRFLGGDQSEQPAGTDVVKTPSEQPFVQPTTTVSKEAPFDIESITPKETATPDQDYLDNQAYFEAVLNKDPAGCDKIKNSTRKEECKSVITAQSK